MRTVDQLLEQSQLTVEELANRTGLTCQRVEAIAMGRWTPSPKERQLIATALAVDVGSVSWGHTMDPRNVRYRQFGLPKDFQAE